MSSRSATTGYVMRPRLYLENIKYPGLVPSLASWGGGGNESGVNPGRGLWVIG